MVKKHLDCEKYMLEFIGDFDVVSGLGAIVAAARADAPPPLSE
jgi:hypothetical protein